MPNDAETARTVRFARLICAVRNIDTDDDAIADAMDLALQDVYDIFDEARDLLNTPSIHSTEGTN